MSLSITCQCGAKLEIDEKFAGRAINCPDCNRPLKTKLAEPEAARTSSLALASLLLALVGAFTVVGTIAAIVCGVIALGQIRRTPAEIGGRRFAQAGIVVGGIFTLLTLVVLWSGDLLRIDGYIRTIEWAGKIEYPAGEKVAIIPDDVDRSREPTIDRPSAAWAKLTHKAPDSNVVDDLVLVNLWEDAYIVCLTKKDIDPQIKLDDYRPEGRDRFLQSDLVRKILGRVGLNSPPLEGKERDGGRQIQGTEIHEFILDVRLAGIDRTFLIRVLREGTQLKVLAAGTRQSRFARLLPEFTKALDSYRAQR